MDDVCHNSFDVAIPLCMVKRTVLSGSFPCSGVGYEHAPSSLTLGANHTTHLQWMMRALVLSSIALNSSNILTISAPAMLQLGCISGTATNFGRISSVLVS